MLRRIANAIPVIPILRGPARGCLWVPKTSSHGVWLGTYEVQNVKALTELVAGGMTVWDVGANVGAMSLILCRLVGPNGWVVAIEPSPQNARALRRHVGKNAIVIEAAVSKESGWMGFSGDGRSDAGLTRDGPLLVKTVTLDSLLDTVDGQPSLVKLDIEGHELPAFQGAERLLRDVRPLLLVEFHGAGMPERDLDSETMRLVASYGYTWRQVPDGWFLAAPR